MNQIAGPWGGRNGFQWDDGVYSGIRQVVISSSSDGIHFIQFEYDKKGQTIWSDKHGGNSGTRTDQIKLDYPTQFLVSISGYYGPVTRGGSVIVRSLFLESNSKNYGPFGIEQGVPFSLPVSGEMIVGFHGWSSRFLHSIGVYLKPLGLMHPNLLETHKMIPTTHVVTRVPGNGKKILSLGPWGGGSGMIFDDGIYTGVREVHITRSGGLVSIRVCYDQNGKVVWGNKNGGTGGLKHDKIVFDYPYEVLTHITGYYGSTILRGPTIVKSITFHTNKRSYGPFGDQQGFSFASGSIGAIVGFHGRNGYFVDSIGVHVLETKPALAQPYPDPSNMSSLKTSEIGSKPVLAQPYPDAFDTSRPKISEVHSKPVLAQPYPDPYGMSSPRMSEVRSTPVLAQPYPDPFDMSSLKNSEVVWGVPKQPDISELGPWGGEGGKAWDDGVYTGVKKIILTRGDAICSIQFQYDQHGHSIWSAPHGRPNDACTYHIKIDYPNEVLTSISGNYYIVAGDVQRKVIRSLTFQTNRTNYGPYGKPVGSYFSTGNTDGKIVGFHGRSGTLLDAIGVHMQHWVNDELSRHSYPPEKGGIKNLLHRMYK